MLFQFCHLFWVDLSEVESHTMLCSKTFNLTKKIISVTGKYSDYTEMNVIFFHKHKIKKFLKNHINVLNDQWSDYLCQDFADMSTAVPHLFIGIVDYVADEIVPDNNLSDFFPVIGLLAQH